MESKLSRRELVQRLGYYLYPYFWPLLFSVLFLMVARSLEVYIPIVLSGLAQNYLDGTHFSYVLIKNTTLFLISLLVFSYLCDMASVVLKTWSGQKALRALREGVFSHIQHLPLRFFDKAAVGKLMTRTIHDVDQINQMFTESIVPLLGSVFLVLFVCVGVMAIDTTLAILFFAALPFVACLAYRFQKDQETAYERTRKIVSKMNAFIQERLLGAMTVRLFGSKEREEKAFSELCDEYRSSYVTTGHNFAYLFAGIDVLQSCFLIALFAVMVAFQGGVSGGKFFAFSLYVIMIFRPISDLSERYNVLLSAMAAAKRTFNVLDELAESDEEKGLCPETVETISFENVWFAYEEENWVLRDVSFSFNRGEAVAIVGMTGAGKSTLLSLLLRYYEVQKGRIAINGIDIRTLSRKKLRSFFGVVLQDPTLFSGTIEENITLNANGISRDAVLQAVDLVNFAPYLSRFKEGVEKKISERGSELSAGEKQLLSLARAVAQDRQVLLLDEATANIDSMTERSIQEALERILKKGTSFVIAHRLSTIRDAKKILVFHRGKLVEEGVHEELLEKKGVYEKLHRLQFMGGGNSTQRHKGAERD